MKKGDIYFIVIVLIEIALIIALIWFSMHSLYVTHEEFLAAIGIIITAISGGFWAFWSKLSEVSKDIGYLKGRLNGGELKKEMKEE